MLESLSAIQWDSLSVHEKDDMSKSASAAAQSRCFGRDEHPSGSIGKNSSNGQNSRSILKRHGSYSSLNMPGLRELD